MAVASYTVFFSTDTFDGNDGVPLMNYKCDTEAGMNNLNDNGAFRALVSVTGSSFMDKLSALPVM